MNYLSPILNATLDSAHQNFLFSPINVTKIIIKMIIFFAKFALPKKYGCIIFLLTLAYSQIVKSFLSQYDKLCNFSKKKKTPNSSRMGVHSLNELLVSFEGYFSPILMAWPNSPVTVSLVIVVNILLHPQFGWSITVKLGMWNCHFNTKFA